MVPADYHTFFGACASVAGALIGLLFVAVSIAPHHRTGARPSPEYRIRSGLAFSALVNTLTVALVALLPGENLGGTGIALGAAGISSMAGLTYVGLKDRELRHHPLKLLRPALLAVMFGFQLANAVRLEVHPHRTAPISTEALLSIVFFLIAIDRSWELVGGSDSGLLGVLIGELRTARKDD